MLCNHQEYKSSKQMLLGSYYYILPASNYVTRLLLHFASKQLNLLMQEIKFLSAVFKYKYNILILRIILYGCVATLLSLLLRGILMVLRYAEPNICSNDGAIMTSLGQTTLCRTLLQCVIEESSIYSLLWDKSTNIYTQLLAESCI